MRPTDRRSALLALSSTLLAALGVRKARAEEKKPVLGAWELFLSGKRVEVDASSSPVRWKGYDYRLVRIGRAVFFESALGRVTAQLTAGVTTFDNVEYDVHVALFDEAGRLLGTAKTVCEVERLWLGKTALESRQLALDFGISKAYRRAKWFTVAITERDVLTPDQWQKS